MSHSKTGAVLKTATDRFCDRFSKRFRRVLCRSICELGLPIETPVLETVVESLTQTIQVPLLKHVRQVLASSSVIQAQAAQGQAVLFSKNNIFDKSNRALLHTVKTILRRQMQEYFVMLDTFNQVSRDLEAGIGELEDYASGCVHDVNVSLFTLLDIDVSEYLAERTSKTTELDDCICDVETEPKHELVDAFGRAILVPVELLFGVSEVNDDCIVEVQHFPRPFCGPVLEVLRSYIIGIDKYNQLNQALMKSLNKLLQRKSLEVDECRSILASEPMQKAVAAHSLHILKILVNPARRENLVLRMNQLLSQRHPDLYLDFTPRHVNMLTNAWARFVFEQMAPLPEGCQALQILEYFLPGCTASNLSAA